MRFSFKIFTFLILIVLLSSCSIIKTSPKYQLANGYYKSKYFSQKSAKIYVDNEGDTINVYNVNKITKQVDTTILSIIKFPQKKTTLINKSKKFLSPSFDVDFVTMPFKYRSTQKGFPKQFNVNLNGAVYFGFRNDIYQVRYKQNSLNQFNREITHYGFSFGLFTGLGGAAINPFVTNNALSIEYDGLIWSKGAGAIIGINNVTVGLGLGFDYLLDTNKDFWIYQDKPWLGLVFGLNLN